MQAALMIRSKKRIARRRRLRREGGVNYWRHDIVFVFFCFDFPFANSNWIEQIKIFVDVDDDSVGHFSFYVLHFNSFFTILMNHMMWRALIRLTKQCICKAVAAISNVSTRICWRPWYQCKGVVCLSVVYLSANQIKATNFWFFLFFSNLFLFFSVNLINENS